MFYQVIKVFFTLRVSKQIFKTVPGLPASFVLPSDAQLEGSQRFSAQELICLKFLEANYEICFQQQSQLTSFRQLNTCLHFAACIFNYVGGSQKTAFQGFRKHCQAVEDRVFNSQRLIAMMEHNGIQNGFSAEDLAKGETKEMLIFTIQL